MRGAAVGGEGAETAQEVGDEGNSSRQALA
jgi:hypothetical protein